MQTTLWPSVVYLWCRYLCSLLPQCQFHLHWERHRPACWSLQVCLTHPFPPPPPPPLPLPHIHKFCHSVHWTISVEYTYTFCLSSHLLQEGFKNILLLLDLLMGEYDGYKDWVGTLWGCHNKSSFFSHLLKISLLSIYCSAASTPCSTSASNISIDLCACNRITCLCTGKHSFLFYLYAYLQNHSQIVINYF